MYSLELTCSEDEVELAIADLWEHGTIGIRELDNEGVVSLIATFETDARKPELFKRFTTFSPRWYEEPALDWVEHTHRLWPAREDGTRLFLAPPWCGDQTPQGRVRLVHQPGKACGTGEHPCTQLALEALELTVQHGWSVVEVGTGAGLLGIAAKQLGAGIVLCLDTDSQALLTAKENATHNGTPLLFAAASADAVGSGFADLLVANISGTVLLNIFDELERITKKGGILILTGFTQAELPAFTSRLRADRILEADEWRCIVGRRFRNDLGVQLAR